jgi:hypothetical protein
MQCRATDPLVPVSHSIAISGDSKYGIPVLDPILVDRASVQESGITVTVWNFSIEGAKDAVLEDFRYSTDVRS